MPRRSPALDRAAAAGTRSGGHPPAGRREHRVRFWEAIARGASSVDAAAEAGVLPSIGVRWFRKGGGMPPLSLAPVSGRYLSFAEREEIAVLLARGCGVREIARQLGRAPSTISRELQRNSALRTGRPEYSGLDRADACRSSRSTTEAGEARGQPGVASLCAGPARRSRAAARRERCRSADQLGWAASRTAQGPTPGTILEPEADLLSTAR
jgi:hypothetical protein